MSCRTLNRSLRAACLSLLGCLTVACAPTDDSETLNVDANRKDSVAPALDLCVAVRGNGPRVPAHFGALARIHEEFGEINAISGGSSGSITSFLLDSIYLNPALDECNGGSCSKEERSLRAALLLKSLIGYFEVVGDSEEGLAIRGTQGLVSRIRSEGIAETLESDNPFEGVDSLIALLSSPELASLINPEVIALLKNSPDPVFHARDLVAGLQAGASFNVDSERVFLRPSLFDFQSVARKLGRVGSFYAGLEPVDVGVQKQFLDECAEPTKGMNWKETSATKTSSGTCGSDFKKLVGSFRAALLANEATFSNRADDLVGKTFPVLVSTSVVSGTSQKKVEQARSAYLEARDYAWNVLFEADVHVGYFGSYDDLFTLKENNEGFNDLKTRMMTPIYGTSWADALRTSPAEPGLSAMQPLPDGRLSAGGWPDLYPVQALKNLGCEKVIYVTKRGGMVGSFADQVASALGAQKAARAALFSLSSEGGSFTEAVLLADGNWCADWDVPNANDFNATFNDGYSAPLETDAPELSSYARTSNNLSLEGCTPGIGQ
jgi:hypothetical protein